MVICRETLEREIANSEKMIVGNEEAIEIHKIVLEAFKSELAKLPEEDVTEAE